MLSGEIINCLKFSYRENNEYTYELAIIDSSEEYKNYLIDILAKMNNKEENEEKSKYMWYYLDWKLKCRENLKNQFSRFVNYIDDPLPSSITLMIKLNNEVVGRIVIGPLVNGEPEIGYAIKQKFFSKGITKRAIGTSTQIF